MEKDLRKKLLKEVKMRMLNRDYDELQKIKSVKITDDIVVLNDRCLSEQDIMEFYNKVEEMQNDDRNELNAIGQLININEYELLDDSGKQRYVLNLSNIYLKLKNDCLNNKKF